MKKLKIALLIIFIANTAMAQTDTQPATAPPPPPPPIPTNTVTVVERPVGIDWQSFRLGLEVEPLLSWGKAKDNSITSSGVKFGYGGGIMGDVYFARNYALNIGLTFIYLGAPVTYDSATNFKIDPNTVSFPKNTTVNYKLQYVDIPIDFKLKTDQVGYLSYFGQFGGEFGFNIGKKADFTTPGNVSNYSDVKLSSNVNVFNAGLLIAIGAEYNVVGHTNLMISLSYINNFTNFTGDPANAAVNHLNLNIGVFF